MKTIISIAACVFALAAPPAWAAAPAPYHSAHPLNILLTNDDGYNAPGIRAVYKALTAAGHHVTLVAPLTQQSGKGGSLDTNIGKPVAVVEQQPGIWSVASTPADCVRAGLDVIMANDPPDVVIAGSNSGQNMSRPIVQVSGTVNAALQGLFRGLPAIAVSTGVKFSEAGDKPPFPSTLSAFAPTGELVARLLDALYKINGPKLLPKGMLLNVNVPVPYKDVQGLRFAPLAKASGFDIRWRRAPGKDKLMPTLVVTKTVPAAGTDVDLFRKGFVVLTAINGYDMSANPGALRALDKLALPLN